MHQTMPMLHAEGTDHSPVGIAQQHILQVVTTAMGGRVFNRVGAQSHELDSIPLERGLHLIEPPQLGGAERSPTTAVRLQHESVSRPDLRANGQPTVGYR